MKIRKLLMLALSFGVVAFSSPSIIQINKTKKVDAETITDVDMGQMYNFMVSKSEHYPISDKFIEDYQQASGGYIAYAKKMGVEVNAANHSPNQKWHFFDSWIQQSLEDGTLRFTQSAKTKVYTGLLCPELLLWIYEACGVSSDKVQSAYDVAVAGKIAGTATSTIAKNMRGVVAWDDLLNGIKSNVSSVPYHVSYAKDCVTTGLVRDGYQVGDTVTFNVTPSDNTKEIESVTGTNNLVITKNETNYSFVMPANNVDLTVTFKESSGSQDQGGDNDDTPTAYTIADVDFPVDGQTSVSSYFKTWSFTTDGLSFNVENANNNNNGWEYIGIGAKASENVAKIYNTKSIVEKINNITIDVGAASPTNTNSIHLLISNNSDFSEATTIDLSSTITKKGIYDIAIPELSRIRNGYYSLVFSTKAGSSNGFIKINQIKYLSDEYNTLTKLELAGESQNYIAGSTFACSKTGTATYSISGEEAVSGFTYTLNGEAIKIGDTIPVSAVNDEAPIVVSYTDIKNQTISAEPYYVEVSYKEVSSISLNYSEFTLSKSSSLQLIATVSDEYADHSVLWSTSDATVCTVSNGLVTSLEKAGTATITAAAVGGKTATCVFTVTEGAVLDLVDSDETNINDKVYDLYTGCDDFVIKAVSNGVDNPSYVWESSNTNVATVVANDASATVKILAAGTANISVTVGTLTKKISVNVTQSAVTSLILSSSVTGGTIYNGTYLNTLTLTPSITKVGNATEKINWSTNNEDLVSLSSESTTGSEELVVTGLKAGDAVITATSDFTKTVITSYTVHVVEDLVKTLTWNNRPAFTTFSGTSLKDAAPTHEWTFSVTWVSGKDDSPVFGTGENDIHIGLYSSSTPTTESTPIGLDYEFSLEDSGKYLVAYYKGKFTGYNKIVTVNKWRSVLEGIDNASCGFDFLEAGGGTKEMTKAVFDGFYQSGTLLEGKNTYSKVFGNTGSIKLGTGNFPGYISMVFGSTVSIKEIKITAKQFSSGENTLIVNDYLLTLTDEFAEYSLTRENNDFNTTNEVMIETLETSKRAIIKSIEVIADGKQEIGKTEDCLGILAYIDTYLHMEDYTEQLGYCADKDHNYYGKDTQTGAKYNFNKLNDHQRELFASNEAYASEYARLCAWAVANGDSLNLETNKFEISSRTNFFDFSKEISIISIISLTISLGLLIIYISKKKFAK